VFVDEKMAGAGERFCYYAQFSSYKLRHVNVDEIGLQSQLVA